MYLNTRTSVEVGKFVVAESRLSKSSLVDLLLVVLAHAYTWLEA